MIVLVYYISDHFRKTANLEGGKKNPLWPNEKSNPGSRELAQAGTAAGTRGLRARCDSPDPTPASSDAGTRKGQRAPGGILFLLQTLAKRRGCAPHTLPLPRPTESQQHSDSGGRREDPCCLGREKGSSETRGEMPEGSGEPRGDPAPVGTLAFITLLLGDEEGA